MWLTPFFPIQGFFWSIKAGFLFWNCETEKVFISWIAGIKKCQTLQKKLIRKCIDDRIDSWGHGDIGQKHLEPTAKSFGCEGSSKPRNLIKWVFAVCFISQMFFLGHKKNKIWKNFYQKTHHYSCNSKQTWLVSFSCTNVQIVSKELNRKVWEVCPLFFSYKLALAELPQHPSVIYEASLMFARNIFSPRWLFLLSSFDLPWANRLDKQKCLWCISSVRW